MPDRNYEFTRKIVAEDGTAQMVFFFVIDTNTFLSMYSAFTALSLTVGKHYKRPKNEWMRDQLAPLKW